MPPSPPPSFPDPVFPSVRCADTALPCSCTADERFAHLCLCSACRRSRLHVVFQNATEQQKKGAALSFPSLNSEAETSSPLHLYPEMGAGPNFTSSQEKIMKWKSKGTEQNTKMTPNLKSVILLLPSSSSLCLILSISRRTAHASYPTCEVWLKSKEIQLVSMKNVKFFLKNCS